MCPIFTTLALLFVVLALIYIYLVWNFGYWKRLGIKEAKSYPFTGSLPNQFTQKRHVIYDYHNLYNQYKRDENFVGIISCRTPHLLVVSPEYARKVFVNDFKNFHDNEFTNVVDKKRDIIFANNPFILTGNEWKERRAEITPGLTINRIIATYPVTLEICNTFSKYIATQMKMASRDDGIEAKSLCLRFTTEVVGDCVLGIKARSLTEQPTPIYSMIRKSFDQTNWFILYMAIATLIPQIKNFYRARFFPEDIQEFFIDLMKKSIKIRRDDPSTNRTDFLNYILQLQEKKNLNIVELTSHTITFLTDGFETTATVLAHTLLLLARHPEAQEKLRTEIGTETLSFEKLSELPYLDACVHETLRLFSIQLVAKKLCTEACEFVNKNGTTLTVNPGTVVLVPIYSLHRDPDIYEDAESFKPERFLEENGGVKRYREMGAFLGFGDGPRACFGMRFALTQIKAAVVQILRDFNVRVNKRTRTDYEYEPTYFMSSLKGGSWLNFEERN